jgi:hypothetical protein
VKLPKFLKRKKKSEDGEDEVEEEEAEAAAEDEPEEEPEEGEKGEEGEGGGKLDRRKRLILIAAGAGVLLLGVLGGAGWWLFKGDAGANKTAAQGQMAAGRDAAGKGPRASLAMPPAPGSLNTLVAPTPGQARLAAPAAPGQAARPGVQPASGPSGAKFASKVGEVAGAFTGSVDPLGGSLNAMGSTAAGQAGGIIVPAVTSSTVNRLPDQPPTEPLPATPDARLVEEMKGSPAPLPRIGKDGAMAWQVYARPNKVEEGARVAIIMVEVGLSRAATMAAITKLPPEITMVLDPYAKDLSDWVVRSRLAGHEVMIGLPMESERFPIQDAGPFAMDTSLSAEDNVKRLEALLSQVSGYTGVATMMGTRFGTSEALLTPVLEALKGRGLMLVTTGPRGIVATPKIAAKVGLPRAASDLVIDEDPSRLAIEAKLNQLEELVRQRQVAVAVAHPYPATVERLINWTTTLKFKKITLVPVSALANKQKAE